MSFYEKKAFCKKLKLGDLESSYLLLKRLQQDTRCNLIFNLSSVWAFVIIQQSHPLHLSSEVRGDAGGIVVASDSVLAV